METMVTNEIEVDLIGEFNRFNKSCDLEIAFNEFQISCRVNCKVELWQEADADYGQKAEYCLNTVWYDSIKVEDEDGEEVNLSKDLTNEWQNEVQNFLSRKVDEF